MMACKAELPYRQNACGLYKIECRKCGVSLVLTTAGRPDDPFLVTLPCYAPNFTEIRQIAL